MRKGISVKISIIFASLLLVSHAIVPHLHFNNEIFIITPTCITDDYHRHNAPEHNNNESEDDRNFCLLKQIVLARLNDSEISFYKPILSGNNYSFDSILAILNDNLLRLNTESFKIPPALFSASFYSLLVDCNVNSRGSPLV